MNWIIQLALNAAHVPDQTIADTEKALPGFARLCAAAKELEPILQKMQPLIAQAEPIVLKAYPDFVADLPVAEELIESASQKGT